MPQASRKPHPAKLPALLERNLKAYVLTAASIGAGVSAAAAPAEAKIVYIPANKVLTNGMFTIPLGQIPELTIFDGFKAGSFFYRNLSVRPLHGAGVSFANGYARALGSGATIGPNGDFQTTPAVMERAFWSSDNSMASAFGPWSDVSNRYLGLRFEVNGQTHYGWARFSVSNSGSLEKGVQIKATFTGLAVESEPDQSIQAGKTSGPTEESVGSLGCLAFGCGNSR